MPGTVSWPLGRKNFVRRILFFAGILLVLSYFLRREAFQLYTSLPSTLASGHDLNPTTPSRAVSKSATSEPVVLMWSKSSAMEGALLVKSILMYNSRPTDLHIICDNDAEQVIRARLQLTDHSAGLPGLMKLFIHEILPTNITKAIFVDAFFIADPAFLWGGGFRTLKPQTSIVMPSHPDQSSPEWNHASRVCSSVMLLDLKKLRKAGLMGSNIINPDNPGEALSYAAFRTMYGLPGGDGKGRYTNVRLGDQGYWWAIVNYHKDIFEPLSYDFEEEELAHQRHTPQEGRAVLPKLLHFTCFHGYDVCMEWSGWDDPSDFLNVRWGPALRYHNGFKWIWLKSRRPGEATGDVFKRRCAFWR